MLKFIAKCIIVLLALQSAMNFLRKEEIIEGSIKIKYTVIQQKVLAAIPTKKIAAGILEFAVERIHDAVTNDDEPNYRVYHVQQGEEKPGFKIVNHVVDEGETLEELSQRYGVHWRVIQRVNHLIDGNKLFTGQRLRIPSKMHKLI
jgi:nucleoid-associated protein YgaU